METMILTCRECGVTGELGLVIEGLTTGEYITSAQSGALIAHDLIEHQNGPAAIGGVGDELIALGAIWFTRGNLEDITRTGSRLYGAHGQIAADVANVYRYFHEGFNMPVPKTVAGDIEEDIRDILREAIEMIKAESDDEDEGEARIDVARYIRGAKHFMRAGWLQISDKWMDVYQANNQFWAIADAVEPHAKACEYEDEQFVLTYGEGEALCEPMEYFEDEDEE